MGKNITLFHGSKRIVEHPVFGLGRVDNDYGQGFYCTDDIELAKEWAWAFNDSDKGYANIYDMDMPSLKTLNLCGRKYNVLHWISLLLKNRNFDTESDVGETVKEYLIRNFSIDVDGYDLIRGYRADDSYFSFARDFLNNSISVEKLSRAMRLGELGEQIVLKSERAFGCIRFIGSEEVPRDPYYYLRMKRDERAKSAYRRHGSGTDEAVGGLYALDIVREGVKEDDPRLR